MMKLVCFSDHQGLLDDLSRHYGDRSVITQRQWQQQRGKQGEDGVLLVDLLRYQLPADLTTCPVIVLVPVPQFAEAVKLLRLGVKGYGNRKMRLDNLCQAIDHVYAGQIWLPPEIVTRLIAVLPASPSVAEKEDPLQTLSEREKEVAAHLAQGLSNQGIAEKLYVSERTVKAHLSSIYGKTGLRNRLELGLYLKERQNA